MSNYMYEVDFVNERIKMREETKIILIVRRTHLFSDKFSTRRLLVNKIKHKENNKINLISKVVVF